MKAHANLQKLASDKRFIDYLDTEDAIYESRKKRGLLTKSERRLEREMDLLFGVGKDGSDLSVEEFNIVFDPRLSLNQKLAKLKPLRAPKQFDERVTDDDRLRARGMGIKLD